jgi:hypothetical protein
MAAVQGIPMDEFLSKQSQALRDWIKHDLGWKTEEIHSVMVGPDPVYTPERCHVTIDRKVEGGYETREQDFIRSIDGEWRKV